LASRSVATPFVVEAKRAVNALVVNSLHQQQQVVAKIDSAVKSVFDMFEFKIPRTFVILPYELEQDTSEVSAAEGKLDAAIGMIERLTELAETAQALSVEGVKEKISIFFTGHATELFLYLIDEETGHPIFDGETYPIKIDKRTPEVQKQVEKLMPLMNFGLKAMKAANAAGGLARCFGIPAPSIPASVMKKAQSWADTAGDDSSVAGFDCLTEAVSNGDGEGSDTKALR